MTKNTIPDLQWSLNYVLLRIHIYVICSIVLQWGIYIVCLVRSSLKCSVIQYIHCILYSWQAGKATFWFSFVPELRSTHAIAFTAIPLHYTIHAIPINIMFFYLIIIFLFLVFFSTGNDIFPCDDHGFSFQNNEGVSDLSEFARIGHFPGDMKSDGGQISDHFP